MKKKQREVFLALAREIDWNLCGFCRYHHTDGSSPCEQGDESESWCESPIDAISGDGYDIPPEREYAADCWGFSAFINLDDVADIVGMALAKRWDTSKMSYVKYDDGRIKVRGGTPEEIKERRRRFDVADYYFWLGHPVTVA